MELLQWHRVCELGGDKLHRPPVVALTAVGLHFPALIEIKKLFWGVVGAIQTYHSLQANFGFSHVEYLYTEKKIKDLGHFLCQCAHSKIISEACKLSDHILILHSRVNFRANQNL